MYVIAEIGNTHNGEAALAQELIHAASESGAHAVKLQKKSPRDLYTRDFFDSPYDNPVSYGPTYGLHKQALELPDSIWYDLQALADKLKIDFFATPFDIPSLNFLDHMGVPAIKVASAFLRNTVLLQAIAELRLPVIMSTGGAKHEDLTRARQILPDAALLHCTAIYPTPDKAVYLGAISDLKYRYPGTVVGYSNHAKGTIFPIASYCYGGRILEVHFTLDRTAKGRDHALSFEPDGLKHICGALERLHIGCQRHKPALEDEQYALIKMGYSLVAARDLPRGHTIASCDIAIKAPGGGMEPYRIEELLGQRLINPLHKDDLFPGRVSASDRPPTAVG